MDDKPVTPAASEPANNEPTEVKSEETKDETDEPKSVEIPQENWRVSPLFYEITSYLGIEEGDYEKSAEKVSVITDWAIMKAGSNKVHDILPVIRELEDKIVKPSWGETRINNLYRYLRLAVKRDAFDKAMKAFEDKK